MLEFDGIPYQKEEDNDRNWCHTKITEICTLIGVAEVIDDIDIAHRLHNNRIIVLFNNRRARNRVYFARFNLKGKTVNDINLPKPEKAKGLIWINESLSIRRRRLLGKSKDRLDDAGIVFGKNGVSLYTSLGNIRVNYNGQVYAINKESDINFVIHKIKTT